MVERDASDLKARKMYIALTSNSFEFIIILESA